MNLKRILLALVCIAVLALSWGAVLSKPKDEEKQRELIERAEQMMSRQIYEPAASLLQEAAALNGKFREEAEEKLKTAYLALAESDTTNRSEYVRAYLGVLERQMSAAQPRADAFYEAAQFHLRQNDISLALAVLRDGVSKTGDISLKELYEANRYAWKMERDVYEEVTAIYNGSIQVRRNGLWGLASRNGKLVIPCLYEAISTFETDRAVVMKDGEIYAVNTKNNRVALLEKPAAGIGNLAQNRIPLQKENGMWFFGDASLATGTAEYEAIGMYSNGCAAVKVNGKWGVIDSRGGKSRRSRKVSGDPRGAAEFRGHILYPRKLLLLPAWGA